jgi:hypothetical protein
MAILDAPCKSVPGVVGAASQINNAAPSDAGVLTYEMLKNYFAESNEPPSTFIRLERLPKLTPEQQKKMEQDFSKMIDRIFIEPCRRSNYRAR